MRGEEDWVERSRPGREVQNNGAPKRIQQNTMHQNRYNAMSECEKRSVPLRPIGFKVTGKNPSCGVEGV